MHNVFLPCPKLALGFSCSPRCQTAPPVDRTCADAAEEALHEAGGDWGQIHAVVHPGHFQRDALDLWRRQAPDNFKMETSKAKLPLLLPIPSCGNQAGDLFFLKNSHRRKQIRCQTLANATQSSPWPRPTGPPSPPGSRRWTSHAGCGAHA